MKKYWDIIEPIKNVKTKQLLYKLIKCPKETKLTFIRLLFGAEPPEFILNNEDMINKTIILVVLLGVNNID